MRAYQVGTNNGSVVGSKITDNTVNASRVAGSLHEHAAVQSGQRMADLRRQRRATNNQRFNDASMNSGKSPTGAYTVDTGAGPWTAVAGTSGGVAVVAWYDTDANSLKYAYNAGASVSGAGAFVGTLTLDTFCGGDFVDIVVDA